MTQERDDIPLPRLREGWDSSPPEPLVADEASLTSSDQHEGRRVQPPSWRQSRVVPIVVAVVTTLILSSLFSDIDHPVPLLVGVMVLLPGLGVCFRRY